MNCQKCKNPVLDNSNQCEWCGSFSRAENLIDGLDHQLTINFFLPKSTKRHSRGVAVMIFIDDKMIHEFLVNDGCDFNYYLKNNNPVIEVSLNAGRNRHKLPDFKFEFNNKKYRIDWRCNWLSIVHFDRPTIFIVNVT